MSGRNTPLSSRGIKMAYNDQGNAKGWSETSLVADFEQFHVDNLSSAHVYLRLKTGESWTSITKGLLEDCAQLTKANSIEGTKLASYRKLEVDSDDAGDRQQEG